MSLPATTEILIVGAGPTGLAAALSLHAHGCRGIAIVDSLVQGENTSRAIVVHAATMEALDTIGCAEPLVSAGQRNGRLMLWDGYSLHQQGDFTTLAPYTKFPYALVVSQHITERVLGEEVMKRGISVFRPFKVVGVKTNDDDTGITDVLFEDGKVMQARYVIGADGARSAVRQGAGIDFADPDGEIPTERNTSLSHMILADVILSSPAPLPTDVTFIASSNNAFLYIPLPPSTYDESEPVVRIGSGIPPSMGAPPRSPSIDYLQNLIDLYGPAHIKTSSAAGAPITITKTIWATRFRTHSAIADTFFSRFSSDKGGAVLLVGDAAHIHSPAGGQGMNLGIRDAVFLGPALAEHIRLSSQMASGEAADITKVEAPLKAWAEDRHKQALIVIRMTKTFLRVAGIEDKITWVWGFIPVNLMKLRNLVLGTLMQSRFIMGRVAWTLSGLGNR